MSVAWNSKIITGIPLSGHDPLFEKIMTATEKGLLKKGEYHVAIMNLINISPRVHILPDVIFGILDHLEPGSGENAADSVNIFELIEEIETKTESENKLTEILKRIGLEEYIEKIGTYKVVYFS